MKQILKDCIDIIRGEGYKLPDNIKIKTAKSYYKDKPFSPSFVDRDDNTVYLMSSIEDKGIMKRLILHELIHLIHKDDYSHAGWFKEITDKLNKKYDLNLPYSAEEMLDGTEIFKKNPDLKRQAYKIFANNSKISINKLDDKTVYKKIPSKMIKEDYFPY